MLHLKNSHFIIIITHLESKNSYIRMLFVDFSSTLNTISSTKMTGNLEYHNLQLDTGVLIWPSFGLVIINPLFTQVDMNILGEELKRRADIGEHEGKE